MRIFVDTNVLVSAFGTRGLCTELLEDILARHHFITSELVLSELKVVLHRKFRMPLNLCDAVENSLRRFEIVPTATALVRIRGLEEPDQRIFATALQSGAEVFVTGDKQLLERVAGRSALRAISPRACWKLIRKRS